MKKLLFCALAFAGLSLLIPEQAQAGGYRYRSGDHHSSYGGRSYRSYRSYDRCEPRYYTYRRPVRVYHRSYYDDCAPRVRYYSAPRLSFHIGF